MQLQNIGIHPLQPVLLVLTLVRLVLLLEQTALLVIVQLRRDFYLEILVYA